MAALTKRSRAKIKTEEIERYARLCSKYIILQPAKTKDGYENSRRSTPAEAKIINYVLTNAMNKIRCGADVNEVMEATSYIGMWLLSDTIYPGGNMDANIHATISEPLMDWVDYCRGRAVKSQNSAG